MPEVTKNAPGTFCWIELATHDANKARDFYTALFGWSVNEVPMGENGFYYILQKNGRDVGALYELYPEMRQQGVPSHWMTYVAVESVDDAIEKAKPLGARLTAGPFDVFDSGRMAVLADPQGSSVALWQPKSHIGVGIRDEAGSLCWNELHASDVDAAKRFYTSLFGWTTKDAPDYSEWQLDRESIGGLLPKHGDVPSFWLPYFAVDDTDAVVAQLRSLGGAVYVEPRDIPTVGRFSVVTDPQGAVFSVIKLDLTGHK